MRLQLRLRVGQPVLLDAPAGVAQCVLPGGSEKMIIDGDATDTVILNGQDLSDISGGTLGDAGITSDYMDVKIDGENYIKFVHAGLDLELYVHSDLVDDTPM